MRSFTLVPVVALASTLLLGCGEHQSPSAPVDPTAVSLSVERSTQYFGFGFGDEQHVVILGATAENWAAFCATGAQNWDPWTVLIVTRPDGSQKVGWQGEGLHALVWNLPADVCAEEPDFTGTARLINHDNDLDLSAHGADASGVIATGTVTDESGGQFRLRAVVLGTIAPIYNSVENYVLVTHVQNVQLTPIGR